MSPGRHAPVCENILSGACTVALQWTIRIIAIGVCPASHSHRTSNVALAKQPHTQQLTVGMGPVGRGDIDWKHARPLVAAVATGGSECGCAAPKPVMSLSWHFCRPRMSALGGAKRTSAGGRPPASSARQNSSGQGDPNRRETRVLPRRWPDAARCGPVRGPAPTPYSHTPPHAGARRHAASPMTLVDAHRAARRDSPVLPVRIFPVGLSRPNPGREA